jgi:hypothetical protein
MRPTQAILSTSPPLGVDLGIKNVVAISTGRFWSDGKLNGTESTGNDKAIFSKLGLSEHVGTFSGLVVSKLIISSRCFTVS